MTLAGLGMLRLRLTYVLRKIPTSKPCIINGLLNIAPGPLLTVHQPYPKPFFILSWWEREARRSGYEEYELLSPVL
jgi:hypothetical protein